MLGRTGMPTALLPYRDPGRFSVRKHIPRQPIQRFPIRKPTP